MMNTRIRILREHLNMNQEDFGAKIGVRRSTITNYETGARIPLDTVVSSICREFNVNEVWLRTGEGEMFPPPPEEDDELIEAFGFLAAEDVDPWKKRLAKAFLELLSDIPDEAIPHLRRFLSDASAAMEEKKDED